MTLDQLRFFVAVVECSGFQAAARSLNISQPSISSAVRKLENEFGITLFCRDSYRPTLTKTGKAFLDRAKTLVNQAANLEGFGHVLSGGEEPELSIAIIESAPFDIILDLMRTFFERHTNTKLKIHCEGVRGAEERVLEGAVDLALTTLTAGPKPIESIKMGDYSLIPVFSPQFPAAKINKILDEDVMRDFVQVIIRDSSQQFKDQSFGVIEDAPSCTVNDQYTKIKIIKSGLGWGRVPQFMVQKELEKGELIQIKNNNFPPINLDLQAVRINKDHGPIAQKLWQYLQEISDRNLLSPQTKNPV